METSRDTGHYYQVHESFYKYFAEIFTRYSLAEVKDKILSEKKDHQNYDLLDQISKLIEELDTIQTEESMHEEPVMRLSMASKNNGSRLKGSI